MFENYIFILRILIRFLKEKLLNNPETICIRIAQNSFLESRWQHTTSRIHGEFRSVKIPVGKANSLISFLYRIKGRSQTTLTRFWLFWSTYEILHAIYLCHVTACGLSNDPHPPPLVHKVVERPRNIFQDNFSILWYEKMSWENQESPHFSPRLTIK